MKSQLHILHYLCIFQLPELRCLRFAADAMQGGKSETFRNDQLPFWREFSITHESGTSLPQNATVDLRKALSGTTMHLLDTFISLLSHKW